MIPRKKAFDSDIIIIKKTSHYPKDNVAFFDEKDEYLIFVIHLS